MKPIVVILVDDSPADVMLTRQALAEEPFPIRCYVATDGAQALQLLTGMDINPDLMILDLNMPRVSGPAFLERYRPNFPVVVFSASTNLDDRDRALELGAREFVRKPNHIEAFTDQVSQIVRQWVPRQPDHREHPNYH
jgi:CheY-like chemotaxis protein